MCVYVLLCVCGYVCVFIYVCVYVYVCVGAQVGVISYDFKLFFVRSLTPAWKQAKGWGQAWAQPRAMLLQETPCTDTIRSLELTLAETRVLA